MNYRKNMRKVRRETSKLKHKEEMNEKINKIMTQDGDSDRQELQELQDQHEKDINELINDHLLLGCMSNCD